MRVLTLGLLLGLATAASVQARPATEGHDGGGSATNAAAAADASMTEGEVRKVDRGAQKLTLRHGPIPNLEMPDMTMVFRVADPKMLDGLEPRKKVRFKADRVGGQITVMQLEALE